MTDFAKNRKEWVDALRSGQFETAFHRLKRKGADRVYHCPWGVACEIYKQHNPGTVTWHDYAAPDGGIRYRMRINGDPCGSSFPASEVYEYFGFTYEDMRLIVNQNDEIYRSFDEIADYIEAKGT